MFLDRDTEEFMGVNFPNVKIKRDKVIFKKDDFEITIPSELYPLQNRKRLRLFTYQNTAPIQNDQEVTHVFDEMELPVGRCYTNTRSITDRLLKRGFNEKEVQPFVGWIIIDGIPIHHCWLVYKDIHVIDGGVPQSDLIVHEKGTTYEQTREMIADFAAQERSRPNSATKTFGQVLPIYFYVGSKSSPNDGINLFQKLMSKYPNHPTYSFAGMDEEGMTETQKLIYKKQ